MVKPDLILKRKYKVLKPFMHENVKVTEFVDLNPRQATNLLAGGFIADLANESASKAAAKTTK